jgi:RluA family pseudouridine synthase
MSRPNVIELGEGRDLTRIAILYEDRSVLAIDKPAGWMLVPFNWQSTQRNLPAALTSSIHAGDFWARSRNLKFLRNVHRLDGETTGILLLAKSIGAVRPYSDLFRSRRMRKTYLVVVQGQVKRPSWTCNAPLAKDPKRIGRMRVTSREGQAAETRFRVLGQTGENTLLEARPITGRTHQIRVHLLQAGHPVLGDELYGPELGPTAQLRRKRSSFPMALRAVHLEYPDPFLKKTIRIQASADAFLRQFGYPPDSWCAKPSKPPR